MGMTREEAISRQAVIDLIVANHTELNGLNVVMYSPLCKDIKQLPPVNPQDISRDMDDEISIVEPSMEWIPVSERLPEDGKWAIFTDGETMSIERYKMDAIDHFYPSGRYFNLEDVVAWMPLPEPYNVKEVKE